VIELHWEVARVSWNTRTLISVRSLGGGLHARSYLGEPWVVAGVSGLTRDEMEQTLTGRGYKLPASADLVRLLLELEEA